MPGIATAIASTPVATIPTAIATNPALPAPTGLQPPTTAAQPIPQAVTAAYRAPIATPSAAVTLSPILQAAFATQDTAAPLLNTLASVVARPPGIPAAVLAAMAPVLATRLPLDRELPSGVTLKQAALRSGIFLEANLANPAPGQPLTDAKSQLLALRSALQNWLGGTVAPIAPVSRRPPPPLRGETPRAPLAGPAPPSDTPPHDLGRTLLHQTEAALSRIRLMQHASTPDVPSQVAGTAEWDFDLPFVLGQETVMARFQLNWDRAAKGAKAERAWRLRFAVSFSAIGEVGAEIGLAGERTSVTLWADTAETADTLRQMLPELGRSLFARGLKPGAIRLRDRAPEPGTTTPGNVLDSVR
ncbi:MAG: hypothetical protein JWR75_775 [Devosia sp.]|nr:hypothetical protein [Devosia sp.]